uniref:Zgc:85936 n=1 Tax=Tetraodon nigroviridis TaxID=99883 RepID=H3BW37_TETNG
RKMSRLENQLCQAVEDGDPRSVQLLLTQGARPDLVGRKGVAAVHLAAGRETERNTRCLKLLLQHGADPDIKSSEGLTPLHIAALWGCYQNLKLLLMNGGDPKTKDNDGNTPRQLAEQQENRKCAQLLQEYQGSSADTEDDDLPQFQYSLYSDQTDTSGYPESDYSRVSDVEPKMCDLNRSSSHWGPDCPSILSSTRVSAAGPAAPLQLFKEHRWDSTVDMFALKANEESPSSDDKDSPSRKDALSAFHRRQTSRKSVSFRDVDEYFPVFSPEAPRPQSHADFELSKYSDFLDTERMATVLPQQGIDVTSPDHVYVFFRESSESAEEEMEKTVMNHLALEESDDEEESEPKTEAVSKKAASPPVASSSSGTGSSRYSSCDSDHYTSALDASVHPREQRFAEAEPDGKVKISSQADKNGRCSDVQTEAQTDEDKFTPSPFVTGRTRSRMSRCSLRTSKTPESLLFTSSLFDDSLPTPIRNRRHKREARSTEDDHSDTTGDSPTQPGTLGPGSSVGSTLADTLILSKSTSDSVETQTLSDTIVLEKDEDTSECSSQSDSASASSGSSSFSPRGSSENSDVPCTPGTGCTPRYSMSRLSSCRRPQHLANLSYTPGGRPHILDVDEPVEYLYTDTEQGHRLIETHIPPTSNTSLSSSMSSSSGDETVLYDWRSMQADAKKSGAIPDTAGMTDKELRRRLVELGESPGPISRHTRPTYMRRLCRLMESNSPSPQQHLGYSPELCLALRTFELPLCHSDEQALCQQFDQADQNRKWREGVIKSCFNYLLLDPRVTKNLPFRSHTMSPQECFQTFIQAIFYVGKGKRSRPYSHLYEALEYHRGDKTSKNLCPKVKHILQVWNSGHGVISLHCFQNVIPVEAYTREACMVDAVGLRMLTNRKRGDFYGVVSNWLPKRKRELGIHLLHRAMQIFLAEGERQLRPLDIR